MNVTKCISYKLLYDNMAVINIYIVNIDCLAINNTFTCIIPRYKHSTKMKYFIFYFKLKIHQSMYNISLTIENIRASQDMTRLPNRFQFNISSVQFHKEQCISTALYFSFLPLYKE